MGGAVVRFCGRAGGLRDHRGVIPWQLPPRPGERRVLAVRLLARLPEDLSHAVESPPLMVEPRRPFDASAHETTLVSRGTERMPLDPPAFELVYARSHGLAADMPAPTPDWDGTRGPPPPDRAASPSPNDDARAGRPPVPPAEGRPALHAYIGSRNRRWRTW
jgi:hypothetical protein